MTDAEKIAQIKAVLENSAEQSDTHLLNVVKHILALSWIPSDNIPEEGKDLLLLCNTNGLKFIKTGYYMDSNFYLDNSFEQEYTEFVTHYQYSKNLL